MFHHIDTKYICSRCGSESEPDRITKRKSPFVTETYLRCPECEHESLLQTVSTTENISGGTAYVKVVETGVKEY